MGMYSYFTILGNFDNCIDDIIETLNEISNYTFYNSNDCIFSQDYIKWYDYDSDMIKLSKKYPNIEFALFREYEEGDYIDKTGQLKTTHTYRKFENGKEFLYEIKMSVVPIKH